MLNKILFSLAVTLISTIMLYGQSEAIKGTIKDEKGQPIPFANVVVLQNGVQAGGASSDFDGVYVVRPLNPGTYSIKASSVGYQAVQYNNVNVATNMIKIFDIKMESGIAIKQEVVVVEYKNPLIESDNTSAGGTVTKEDIDKMPARDAAAIASTVGGVYRADDNSSVSVRGTRSDATTYYIDGIPVRGTYALPKAGIEQVSIVTGGIPAEYGDVMGGVISVTTRGPSKEYHMGMEVVSSELTDKYGYNMLGLNISGPLWVKKDSLGNVKPIASFLFAGEFSKEKDPTPSAVGSWTVKDDVLERMKANPIQYSTTNGMQLYGELLTEDSLEYNKYKKNVNRDRVVLNGKISIQPSSSVFVTIGGSFDYLGSKGYLYTNSLSNYENNPDVNLYTSRIFGRVLQKLGKADSEEKAKNKEKKSSINNAFYSIQVDYSKSYQKIQSSTHNDNFFDYGYIGKFDVEATPFYTHKVDTVGGIYGGQTREGNYLLLYYPLVVGFEKGDVNPVKANYTQNIIDVYGDDFYPSTLSSIQSGRGLLNGDNPSSIYSLWSNVGTTYGSYSIDDNEQYRISAKASADVKNHSLSLGFEYEQRIDRNYSLTPSSLWGLMRQMANKHISELDYNNPEIISWGNPTNDTINYARYYNAEEQYSFDKKLREKLGLSQDDKTWINIDNINPNELSLDMFTPDELFNDGNSLVSYYGYDYLGQKVSTNPSLNDFFSEKDETTGEYKRNIPAFQPIYMAGWISDNFAYKDLIFKIGVRIDRFDANQMALKDKYLMYEAYNVKDLNAKLAQDNISSIVHPDGIGEDYVIYVDDINAPSMDIEDVTIVGYRNEDTWYDRYGTEIKDPSVLEKASVTGTITPFLKKSLTDDSKVSVNAFKDYEPKISANPRIAFSFPISDEAGFFAHYDILTQRPTSGIRLDPMDYLFVNNRIGQVINNPDLKPQKSTDYELGFQQKLNNTSALKISAFYKELRDMIQIVNVYGAYPISYLTFDNIDFGTTKGFTVAYDLRRTGNVRLNINYTLQFANGTGSSASSGLSLVSAGQPNLRTIIPLDYDQRHALVGSIDYRYDEGDKYNGPKWKGHEILKNTGANMTFRAGSGTPYSRQSNVTNEAAFGIQQRSSMKGSWNGSNMPWQFKIDLKVDRDILLKWGKGEDDNKKLAYLNVYLQVLNVFNTKNLVGVYRYTGNADDDGYLQSAEAQNSIEAQIDPEAYRDLYLIKVNNPGRYTLPRRTRIGLTLSF